MLIRTSCSKECDEESWWVSEFLSTDHQFKDQSFFLWLLLCSQIRYTSSSQWKIKLENWAWHWVFLIILCGYRKQLFFCVELFCQTVHVLLVHQGSLKGGMCWLKANSTKQCWTGTYCLWLNCASSTHEIHYMCSGEEWNLLTSHTSNSVLFPQQKNGSEARIRNLVLDLLDRNDQFWW